jgi:integrase
MESKLAEAGINNQGNLAEHMATYILHSRADNTVKKYNGYFKLFRAFCESKGLSARPANYMTVALFLTSLLDENKSNSVVSSSVYAIKWMHSIHDFPDPTDNSVVRNLLEASKRLRSKPVVKKDIVDSNMLKSLCALFENNMTLVNLRDLSMILICYAGFLRFNELSSLCCNDVIFNENHIVIKIRVSKTDIYRKGNEVLIAKGDTIACPYKMLQKYMSKADLTVESEQYLFRPLLKTRGTYSLVKVNKQLSYTRAKECIVAKLRLVAPGLKLGTHSLRASGASAAVNFGKVSERCIKRHGRWKSDQAKDGYVQDSLEERLFISKHLEL